MGEASTISKRILKPLYVDIKMEEYIQSIIDNVDSPLLKSKIAFYGSKRTYLLNGILTILAYRTVGGEDKKRIMHAARGISLFSLSGSAFDDVLDDYIQSGLKDKGIDNSATLCSSVALITHGITEIARACEDLTPDRREKIFRYIEKETSSAIDGFQFQIRSLGEMDINENEYIEYICKKCCGAFAKLSMEIGAILGGADDRIAEFLGNFAMNFASAVLVYDHMKEAYYDFKYGFYYPPVLQALKWNEATVRALKNPPVDDVVIDMIVNDEVEKQIRINYERVINKLLDDAISYLEKIEDSEAKDIMLIMVHILREL